MRTKIAKKFTFDAAHRLPFHKGKCKNLHGHTYLLTVIVEAQMRHDQDMVIDFGDLKKVVNKWIVEPFDHATIIAGEDNTNSEFFDMIKKTNPFGKVVVMEQESTAENMAAHFAKTLHSVLQKYSIAKPFNVTVRLHETPNSWAEVTV